MGELSPVLARAAALEAAAQDQPGYYPPERLGLRGSHPGAFEVAHALRDGSFRDHAGAIADAGETYDLIVVGVGSAAYRPRIFSERQYRRARRF